MVLVAQTFPILSDLFSTIIDYVPRIIYVLIVLFLGWVFGRLLSFLVNSIVGKMRLETFFRRVSVGRAILRAGHTPGTFFASLTKGIIYLFSILYALELLGIPLLTDSIQVVVNFIPNIVGGVLILVVGFTFVDWIGDTIEKGNIPAIQSTFLSNIIKLILYFMLITIALSEMRVDVTILYIFAQAFAWSLAIALGVALGWNMKDKFGPLIDSILRRNKSEETTETLEKTQN